MEAHLDDSTNRFALTGEYEPILFEEIEGMEPGSAFIDIGANQGVFTLLAGRQVGRDGRVFAFEPQQWAAALLRRNVILNRLDNVLVFDVALGARTGVVHMQTQSGHSGLAHVSAQGSTRIFMLEPIQLLAALREWIGLRPVTIKIDVEGGELEVLEALRPVLDCLDVRMCLVEIDAGHLERAGCFETDLYQLMLAYGFSPRFGPGYAPHFDEVFKRSQVPCGGD
jgi:FkbM family methyltransferase